MWQGFELISQLRRNLGEVGKVSPHVGLVQRPRITEPPFADFRGNHPVEPISRGFGVKEITGAQDDCLDASVAVGGLHRAADFAKTVGGLMWRPGRQNRRQVFAINIYVAGDHHGST